MLFLKPSPFPDSDPAAAVVMTSYRRADRTARLRILRTVRNA
jgi:hypothetical protein